MDMEDDYFNVPLAAVKREAHLGLIQCGKRGLTHSVKWLSELQHGCGEQSTHDKDANSEHAQQLNIAFRDGIAESEYDNYYLAKSYFDLREYDRAAYFVRNCTSEVPRFLYFYAMYMARDKRRLDSITDSSNLNSTTDVRDLTELLALLRSEHIKENLDGYGLYLYGVVLKAVNLPKLAVPVLLDAIHKVPMLWSAYVELAPLVAEKNKLATISFNGHWMRHFFMAHSYIEMNLNEEAIKAFEELQAAGFRNFIWVVSQMALANHNKRDVERALEMFKKLHEMDPYRLDNMDTYSNLLFVKELKTEMAQLAHKAVSINKYRPETCCIIGNYYSIRCDHQMAILYFQRALKLNPRYLAAWTLMGHEFMELKNTNAAIQSYRKAVEVNKRDYRAWYGLGQSYEILKMHYYSLYYFKIAHRLLPFDSRMLVALGETYERLDKCDSAVKCYWKACDVGDIEGIAMYNLAKLHEKLGEYDLAVQCYVMYCEDERSTADKQSLFHGYMTLANYYEGKGMLDRATHYAYKCLESEERKSEAKSLLKTIENKRMGKVTLSSRLNDETDGASIDSSEEDEIDIDMSEYRYSDEKEDTSTTGGRLNSSDEMSLNETNLEPRPRSCTNTNTTDATDATECRDVLNISSGSACPPTGQEDIICIDVPDDDIEEEFELEEEEEDDANDEDDDADAGTLSIDMDAIIEEDVDDEDIDDEDDADADTDEPQLVDSAQQTHDESTSHALESLEFIDTNNLRKTAAQQQQEQQLLIIGNNADNSSNVDSSNIDSSTIDSSNVDINMSSSNHAEEEEDEERDNAATPNSEDGNNSDAMEISSMSID